jgi:hypothetical protein
MTPDPSRSSGGSSDPGSWNRYGYTRGDPANRVDPQGLMDCETCLDGGGGGAGDPNDPMGPTGFCPASEATCATGSPDGLGIGSPGGGSGDSANSGTWEFTGGGPGTTAVTGTYSWFGWWFVLGGAINVAYFPATNQICWSVAVGAGSPGKSYNIFRRAGNGDSWGADHHQYVWHGYRAHNRISWNKCHRQLRLLWPATSQYYIRRSPSIAETEPP